MNVCVIKITKRATKRCNQKIKKTKRDKDENISLKTREKYISSFDFTSILSQKLWLSHVNYILKFKKSFLYLIS